MHLLASILEITFKHKMHIIIRELLFKDLKNGDLFDSPHNELVEFMNDIKLYYDE